MASFSTIKLCYSTKAVMLLSHVQKLSHVWLCKSMDCSMPGFPVLHHLPKLAQTHVHWVGDSMISPSVISFLLLPSIFPRIRVFNNELFLCIKWPKYWSFSFSISPSNEYSGLISFRMDVGSPCSPRDSQESSPTPQFESIISLVLRLLYGPTLTSVHAAAAAKSLQSCPTLCDPTDGSPPGSPVPGILQARTLKWVAISFSNAWKWKVKVKSLSRVRLLAAPWTAAYQAPPSVGFSRQEYWSGVPLPSPSPWNSMKAGVCSDPSNISTDLMPRLWNTDWMNAIQSLWKKTLGELFYIIYCYCLVDSIWIDVWAESF